MSQSLLQLTMCTPPSTADYQIISTPTLTQVKPSLLKTPQSSSLLLRLPSEIRLIILRELLVSTQPISSRESYEKPCSKDELAHAVRQDRNITVSGYRLAPSIIRVCQKLHFEALPILYYNNTLSITIDLKATRIGTSNPYTILHQSYLLGLPAQVHIFDHECILDHDGHDRWDINTTLKRIASQFERLLITTNISPNHAHCSQLRNVLRHIAPILSTTKVNLTFSLNDLLKTPLPTLSTTDQLRLAKPFTFLRCSSFQFTNLTPPNTLAIQNIITSSHPILDFEPFVATPKLLRRLFASYNWNNPGWHDYNRVLSIDGMFVQAIEDLDVNSFLQGRFEYLKTWRDLARSMEVTGWSVRSALYLKRWRGLRVVGSNVLGMEMENDGEEQNARFEILQCDLGLFPSGT